MLSFRDLEQKWAPKVEALLGNNGGWEKRRRRLREREREKRLLNFCFGWVRREKSFLVLKIKRVFPFFHYFIQALPHVPIWLEQKGPTFSFWLWPILSHKSEKNLTFETLKSCLGLRAVSLVPVPRVSLRPSGPVFESKQYIYQNAQNKTPSVVQRLVSLNSKLHAKRWFLTN